MSTKPNRRLTPIIRLSEHKVMQHVLLIEDGPEIQIMVKGSIGKLVSLTVAPTVSKAMELIEENSFDLFIIDVMLPDGDGFHLCSHLRNRDKTCRTPIIFLTTKSEIKDKVMGFSLGADDYIVKPFDPLELRVRVESKLRKSQEGKISNDSIWKGSVRIDIPSQRAYVIEQQSERDLDLTPNEFKLLHYFARHEGHVLSREHLLDAIWGQSVAVIDRTVDTHICTLRRKLDFCSVYIESIFGVGYRFSPAPSAKIPEVVKIF